MTLTKALTLARSLVDEAGYPNARIDVTVAGDEKKAAEREPEIAREIVATVYRGTELPPDEGFRMMAVVAGVYLLGNDDA